MSTGQGLAAPSHRAGRGLLGVSLSGPARPLTRPGVCGPARPPEPWQTGIPPNSGTVRLAIEIAAGTAALHRYLYGTMVGILRCRLLCRCVRIGYSRHLRMPTRRDLRSPVRRMREPFRRSRRLWVLEAALDGLRGNHPAGSFTSLALSRPKAGWCTETGRLKHWRTSRQCHPGGERTGGEAASATRPRQPLDGTTLARDRPLRYDGAVRRRFDHDLSGD